MGREDTLQVKKTRFGTDAVIYPASWWRHPRVFGPWWNLRCLAWSRPRPHGPCTWSGLKEAGLTSRVLSSIPPRIVRQDSSMYFSSKIAI